MKKLFTLFTKTLLVAVCLLGGTSSAWADASTATIDFGNVGYTSLIGITFSDGTNTTGSLVDATLGESATKAYSSAYTKKGLSTTFTTSSSYSNISGISFYISTSDKAKTNLTVEVCPNSDFSSSVTTVQAEAVMNGGGLPTNVANNNQYYQETYSLSPSVSGYVRIKVSEASGSSNKTINVGKIVITYTPPATAPTITTQPQSASYVTGYAATALHVAATASAGELSYQWYRCNDADKNGSSAISGDAAKAASYTPSTAAAGTFYYFCRVTDSNGSTDSNVATITVAEASAPTISVSGAPVGSVEQGTEVTLTAAVTGNPTPTIQWYSNTTASTDGATELTGETSTTYSPSTAAAGTTYYYAVATNSVSSVTSSFQTVIVQEKLKAPTIDVANTAFVSSIDVTITDNSGKTATIKYSTDNGSSWSDYSTAVAISGEGTTVLKAKVVKDGYIESDEVTGSFKKVAALSTPATVSATTTWDWSKPSTTLQLSGTTIPNTSAADVCAADFDGTVYDAITWGDFNPAALVMSKFQYPVNASNDCFQGTSIKFTTTVPGTITVKFSNTGGGTRPNRYLYVNNSATEYKSNNTTPVTTAPINVAAGEIELKGVIKSADNNNEGDVENYLRIYSITFTPTVSVATLSGRNYASYVTIEKLDFGSAEGITAYIATGLNGAGDAVVMTPVSVVPAGEPIIVKTDTKGATVNVPVTTADADAVFSTSDNKLVAGDGTTAWDGTDGYSYYYLASDQFHKATSGTLQSGKAYLKVAQSSGAPSLTLSFGGDNGTTAIESVEKAVKADGEFYNLNGQRVAQPTKGLYIVNGRKVIIK